MTPQHSPLNTYLPRGITPAHVETARRYREKHGMQPGATVAVTATAPTSTASSPASTGAGTRSDEPPTHRSGVPAERRPGSKAHPQPGAVTVSGTENFMTKIKAKNRKGAPAVAVQRIVSRLEDAYHQTVETRNASKLFSKLWEYHDGHADGIAFALQEVKSANAKAQPQPGAAVVERKGKYE